VRFSASAQDSLSHLSAAIKGSVDHFRVSPSGTSNLKNINWIAPKVAIEYAVNPLVGFGGNVDYLRYDRNTGKENTLDFSLFTSINAANLFVSERKGCWGKVNVYTDLGGGLGLYHYKVDATRVSNNRSVDPFFYVGLNAEYSLSYKVALCLAANTVV
jgi:hypothetical protein